MSPGRPGSAAPMKGSGRDCGVVRLRRRYLLACKSAWGSERRSARLPFDEVGLRGVNMWSRFTTIAAILPGGGNRPFDHAAAASRLRAIRDHRANRSRP